jgi:hypothetical protein
MRIGNRIGWTVSMASLAVAVAVVEASAKVSISVSVEREVMRVGEQNRLAVEMSSDTNYPPNPQVPAVDGLNFYSTGGDNTSMNMTMVGNKMTREFGRTLNFVVVPTREGTFQIQGVTVRQGSEVVVADPIKLTVLKAGAPTPTPSAAQRADQQPRAIGGIQLIAEAEKSRAYVGEGVSVRYILLGPRGMIQHISSFGNLGPALFKRCVVEEVDLGTLRLQPQTYGGRAVDAVVLRHFIVFPLSAGPVDIDPVSLSVDALSSTRRRSFFDFSFQQTVRMTVTSMSLHVEVVPLPAEERPEDFNGAVGDFRLEATVDKRELVEGDALSLQVVLAGTGNVRNCPPPTLPDLSGFDQYESTKKEDISVSQGGVSGRITYEYVLVPKTISSTEIGAVGFSFFNPGAGRYETISTDPIELTIEERGEGSGDRVLLAAGAGAKREIVMTGEDFRHIEVGVAGAAQERLDLYRRPVYIGLLLTPFLLLGGAAVYARHRRRMEMDPEYSRHRRAPRAARRMLSEARQAVSADDRHAAYAAFSKTLVDYVGDRWSFTAGGMTSQDLGLRLRERGLPEECVGELIATLEDFEASRFGGNAHSDLRSDLQRTQQILGRLMGLGKERI